MTTYSKTPSKIPTDADRSYRIRSQWLHEKSPKEVKRFLPEAGAMTVFCWVLGTFDASMIGVIAWNLLR